MDRSNSITKNIFAAVDGYYLDDSTDVDCIDFNGRPAVGFYVGVAGNVVIETVQGDERTLPVGTGYHPFQCKQLLKSDAAFTATNVWPFWNEIIIDRDQ